MSSFIHNDFLLHSKLAEYLYHDVVKNLPIIDYHNHLNIKSLAQNKVYDNLAQLWLLPDPYKHRAMRMNGIKEKYITGNASDYKKFLKWADTVCKTVGNPLFHWSCLELKRCFGYEDYVLTPRNAQSIWDEYPGRKKGVLDFLQEFNVDTICTSDSLFDDLSFHKSIKKTKVYPSLRADSIFTFANFPDEVKSLDDYKAIVIRKLDDFDEAGCRLADHSLNSRFDFLACINPERLFERVLANKDVSEDELTGLKSHLLVFLGAEYAKRNWVMQLHIGARRYTSCRLHKICGRAGGFAAMDSNCRISAISELLNALGEDNNLPGTILYNLNPADNASFATLCGSFTGDGVLTKTQFGPAWWYNDHFFGIVSQLENLSSFSLLSHFIGMTTDSRSVLSFSRHEYFRRILCNTIATWVKDEYLPNDRQLLDDLVSNIAYYNAKRILK